MANENPYMNEQPRRRRGAHFATTPTYEPYEPVMVEPPRRRRSKTPLVIALLLALLCVGGFFGWRAFGPQVLDRLGIGGKKVTITVDGQETRVAAGSTVQEVFEALQPQVTPGDLMAVDGQVLGAGEGDPFSATLSDRILSMDEAASTQVAEGDSLAFSNGLNVTEDYTTETVVTSTPKLVRRADENTVGGGDYLQQGVIQYVYQWGKQGTAERQTGALSGATVETNVVEGQDCIIRVQDIHPDNGEKLVALTFDDGPTYYTEQYLDILDRYGIKATFMLIGEQVEECAGVVQVNAASGNQICAHSWDHPDLTTIGPDALKAQLGDTFGVIKNVGGYDTTSFRPPYGDMDFDTWLLSGGRATLSIYWTHDSEDWKLPGVDTIVSNCTSYMAPGSVILMHDGGGNRDQDLEALPKIIEAWQNAGYRFVTISELMASDSSIPEECCATYRPMPEDAVWPTEKGEEESAAITVG